ACSATPARSPVRSATTCSPAGHCPRSCRCDPIRPVAPRRALVTQVAFAPDVFTWPADETRLIGGRCAACTAVTFPVKPSCPRCGATDVERHLLPRRGTLWSWTTQEFLPKEP